MKALVFHYSLPRLAATRLLGTVSDAAFVGPLAPLRLEQVPEPTLIGDDWLIVRTVRCGICGSDSKQAFLHGNRDNPLTALLSFPHVLGHEAAGVIEQVGPAVRTRRVGERVVLNPWLSCGPRGIDPPCSACQAGDYPLCERFTDGRFSAGIHAGNCRDVAGGFAERIAAHESQAFAIPDGIEWDAAVLADPFSVALHTVLHHPPPAGAPALVFGCGTLGLLTIAILRTLHPDVDMLAMARYDHQEQLALRLGASQVWRDTNETVEGVASTVGTKILRPADGKPWIQRGAGVVYDTVGSAGSVELALRVASPRAAIVVSGVEPPQRFEWTPLYFKEVSIVGSNAFGVETFEGRRMHAMEVYFELAQRGLDVTPIITHRFPLDEYKQALLALRRKGKSGAVKALFTFGDDASTGSA
ncbi:MAG: alcohol dehydrogenase catalytic domain-containing protein [Dehalococcoidia bacterium]